MTSLNDDGQQVEPFLDSNHLWKKSLINDMYEHWQMNLFKKTFVTFSWFQGVQVWMWTLWVYMVIEYSLTFWEFRCYNSNESKYYFTEYVIVKGTLSRLRQFLATESPLQMMKNAFYFTLKALFVLKIFKFLPWRFGHVSKRLD